MVGWITTNRNPPCLFPALGGWCPPCSRFPLGDTSPPWLLLVAPRKHHRAAFAMGMLATKKDDSDLAEALFLEAVLVLDRLPEARKMVGRVMDWFGAVVAMWR